MKAYWRNCGYRHGNFGDELVPLILEQVFHLDPVHYLPAAEMVEADLISIGSILGEIPHKFAGHVWGTGCMFHHGMIDLPTAKFHAVRGHLTRRRIPTTDKIALGDPGLLVDTVMKGYRDRKSHTLSFIPHYADFNDVDLTKWLRKNPFVHVIDPCQPAYDVLREIMASEKVLSSCLHGLIASDSLGVPNLWVRLGDRLAGDVFKFRDYYSLYLETDPIPATICEGTSVDGLMARCEARGCADIKKSLMESFPYELLGQPT